MVRPLFFLLENKKIISRSHRLVSLYGKRVVIYRTRRCTLGLFIIGHKGSVRGGVCLINEGGGRKYLRANDGLKWMAR